MTQEEYEDAKSVASIAQQNDQFFQQQRRMGDIMPDPKLRIDHKKIINRDWRQFQGEMPQPQPYQPYNAGIPNPNEIGSNPMHQIPIGRDEHGNLIMSNDPILALQQVMKIAPQQTYQAPALQTTGFQLPQFNVPQAAPTKPNSVIDEDRFEELIKEIKSMKKSINKLIRLQEQSKLPASSTTKQEDTLENTD